MSDLKPFKHGSEGTHSACDARIEAEGGKATCCYCNPHEGCELTSQRKRGSSDVALLAYWPQLYTTLVGH